MHAIRVDANDKIATGHLMRCMSIAKQLRDMSQKVIFISADEQPKRFVIENGFEFASLGSNYEYLEDEIDNLIDVIHDKDIKAMLFDSYFVSFDYLECVGRYVKTAYIDDIDMFLYPVDLLINYNINYDDFDYGLRYNKEKLLLGTNYVPLRHEFASIKKKHIDNQVKHIMLTTGGADPYDICGQIIKKHELLGNVTLHIVIGKYFKHRQSLYDLTKCYEDIALHENANMSNIMQRCDMAISSGGSTVYELCACGVPAILFSQADNQLGICNKANEEDIAIYAGHYDDFLVEKIIKQAVLLQGNQEMREALSQKSYQLVDGNGAKRIAEKLISM